MANKTLTIEIKVKDETSGIGTITSNSDSLEPISAKASSGEQDLLGSEKLMKDPTVQKGVAAGQMASTLLHYAMNTAVSEAMFQIDYIFATNDDYIGQRNLQVASKYIGAAQSGINSMISGAMMGSSLGVGGMVVGAAIGAAMTIGNIVIENHRGQQMEDLTIRQMQTSLDFTRSRAGFATKAASIGEDL